MKKLALILIILTTGIFLLAADKIIPKRPSNIPEDAFLNGNRWTYSSKIHPEGAGAVSWYLDGAVMFIRYDLEGTKYQVYENYYENGSIKEIRRLVTVFALSEYEGKRKRGPMDIEIAEQPFYYKNGKLKEKRCFTPVLHEDGFLESVLCGSQIFYDETGKEIKRIEHDVKCNYGCDEIPRLSFNQVMAIVALNMKQEKIRDLKMKHEYLKKNPVIGKILSVDSWFKEIEIAYKDGFALNTGDQVCSFIDGEFVSFVCTSNKNGTGKFELKEDKNKKYSSITKDTEPRFYKKNEIKYTDYLKSGSKPKAGDVKIIGGIEFVYIPAGEFYVHDKYNYKEVYKRVIKPFWMTKYEVTLGEFLKYSYEYNEGLPENTSDITFSSRYPVNLGKDYNKAISFCSLFGIKHGVNTELPQADEWEYAARGGTTTKYYWGNDKIGDYVWYKKNSGGTLHPVGEKKPNAYGLYDMIGNAWEWYGSLFIRGGGCRSDERDLQYTVNYMIHFELAESLRMPEPHKDKTSQGTSFRMIIREAE